MGAIYETDKMLRHVEQCGQCKAAANFADRCDAWSDMYENVVDFECGEGPFEGDGNIYMCDDCDGPVRDGHCTACKLSWCVYDVHECSSSDCDECEPCGKPAVGETENGYGHGSFPYCEEHRPAK